MQIKSNTLGKLKKIKDGTVFSNEYMFIREFLQNSQRSKSKIVNIVIEDGYISFEDNGVGCSNPENLFTLDLSDWESTDEGFGIGFWSCLAYRGLESVEIESHNWKARIDVKNIFKNGDLSVEKEYIDRKFKGFKVTLYSNDISWDSETVKELYKKVVLVAKYLEFDVIVNGNLVEKIDIFESVNGDFVKTYENSLFKARIKVSNRCYGNRLNLFYENREVCKLYDHYYVGGVVQPKKKKITLKEPDRAEYVTDYKFDKFSEKLTECIKDLYKSFLMSLDSDSDINLYADAIDEYLDVKDYDKYLNLDITEILKDNCVNDEVAYAGEVQPAIDIVPNLNSCEDAIRGNYTCEDSYNKEVDIMNEAIEESFINNDTQSERKEIVFDRKDFNAEDYSVVQKGVPASRNESSKRNRSKNNFRENIKKVKKSVWVSLADTDEYASEIAKAEYFGLKVLKASNVLYEKAYEKHKILHISNLKNSLVETYSRKNIGIKTNKEESFIKLLQPICKKYDLPINTFCIANIELKRELIHEGKIIFRETLKNSKSKIQNPAVASGRIIYLDRNYLNLSKFKLNKSGNFGINELKIMMYVLKTLAHELAHVLYSTEDNTLNHYKTEEIIYDELLAMYI